MRISAPALAAALALALAAGVASAQAPVSAYKAADGIPQPHLAEALRLAAIDHLGKNSVLDACYRADGPAVREANPPPTRVMDNLYFVGTAAVSAWAIDTSGGIVLIDSLNNSAEAEQYIIGGLKTLGLDPARIKALIISHAHADHFGGSSYLQEKYHARVYMSALDWVYVQDWVKGPYARGRTFVLPHQDVAVKDGDSLTLGDTTIRMFVTPGHTAGPLSLLIPLKYKGQPHTFVFHGGVSSNNNLTPALHAAYDSSTAHLAEAAAQAHADGVMANHMNFDSAAAKIARLRADPNGPNPFIVGQAPTQRWLQIARECNLNNRDIDAALATRKAAAPPQ